MESLTNNLTKSNEVPPQVVYRAEVWDLSTIIHPNLFFKRILTPGTQTIVDENKVIGDGNEYGLYTSSNITMVAQTSYSAASKGYFKIPKCTLRFSQTDMINLPGLGIIYEIDTTNLGFRKPKIVKRLQGVYNNGFEGDEWITDSVPAESYKIVKLVLAREPNDRAKFVIDNPKIPEDFEIIKEKYNEFLKRANRFKDKLLELQSKNPLQLNNSIKIDELYRNCFDSTLSV